MGDVTNQPLGGVRFHHSPLGPDEKHLVPSLSSFGLKFVAQNQAQATTTAPFAVKTTVYETDQPEVRE